MFEKRVVQGAWFALSAYLFWGVVPVYYKMIAYVDAWEIVCHRILWSLALMLLILAVTRGWGTLKVSRRQLAALLGTALLVSTNWLVFIWAILHDRIVETALGYYINPLVSVLLGMIFLGERLRVLQWFALSLAASGIAVQLYYYDAIPWIALTLAFSFGFYGLIRKSLNLPSVAGLALETMLISPLALGYLIWMGSEGTLSFGRIDLGTDLLLVAGGFVTAFPLVCFAAAVTRLSLTAAGMYQYVAPSLSLMIAVLVYGEPFGVARAITFTCIWTALLIISFETWYHHSRRARAVIQPV